MTLVVAATFCFEAPLRRKPECGVPISARLAKREKGGSRGQDGVYGWSAFEKPEAGIGQQKGKEDGGRGGGGQD